MNTPSPKAAAERVELSRSRLRRAMEPPPAPGASHRPWVPGLAADFPALGIALELVSAWWSRQAARPVLQLAWAAFGAAIRPIAREHPFALVLGSGATGGLLMWSRPWRWVLPSALIAGMLPKLASRAILTLPFGALAKMLAGTPSQRNHVPPGPPS